MDGAPGVPAQVAGLTIRLPWDDAEGVEAALRDRERELAAILVEPVQGAGGIRTAPPAFLTFLRELADRTGALLIFDEIISFRLGPAGAQGLVGVRPDLTTLGKIIGGGYPLAAFGGRADVMGWFDARQPGALSHGGTFNGNPVAAAAGLATLRQLTDGVYAELERSTRRLVAAVEDELSRLEVAAAIATAGSLFQLLTGETESAIATGLSRAPDLFLGLLLEGFLVAPRGMGAVAAVATQEDVEDLAAAIGRVLASIGTLEPART